MSMINIPLLYSNTFPYPISTNAFYLLNILPTVYLKIGEHIFCWHWDIPARAVDVQKQKQYYPLRTTCTYIYRIFE